MKNKYSKVKVEIVCLTTDAILASFSRLKNIFDNLGYDVFSDLGGESWGNVKFSPFYSL